MCNIFLMSEKFHLHMVHMLSVKWLIILLYKNRITLMLTNYKQTFTINDVSCSHSKLSLRNSTGNLFCFRNLISKVFCFRNSSGNVFCQLGSVSRNIEVAKSCQNYSCPTPREDTAMGNAILVSLTAITVQ